MRMTVATEKALKPEHIGVVGTADDDRTADPGLEQADAPEDQSPHDPFAKLGFGNQQCPQPIRRDDQGLDRLLCNCVHQCGAARQLGQFAHELARAVHNNETFV